MTRRTASPVTVTNIKDTAAAPADETTEPVTTESAAPAATVPTYKLGPVTVTMEDISDPTKLVALVAGYRALDPKGKAAVRTAVNKAMMTAVGAMDILTAHAFGELNKALVNAPAAAKPVDSFARIADRIAVLEYAAWLLKVGSVTPDGLEPQPMDILDAVSLRGAWPTLDDISARIDELSGDEKTSALESLSNMEKEARALAATKVTRTRSGNVTNWGDAIAELFAAKPVGHFMSVSEIANALGNPKGTGAIEARLFPTDTKSGAVTPTTIEGVIGTRGGPKMVKGAQRV